MTKYAFISVVLAAVVAGCDTGTGTGGETACDDTAGCDTDTTALLIDSYTYECTPDSGDVFGSNWQYDIVVTGANSGGVVIVDQDTTDPWHEEHDLTGTGTALSVTLVGANADPLNQTANVSSLFQCGMDTAMVWRYEVYPPEGGATPADCVVASGADTTPDTVWGADFGGCANGNSW